jgi:hypothetical protein
MIKKVEELTLVRIKRNDAHTKVLYELLKSRKFNISNQKILLLVSCETINGLIVKKVTKCIPLVVKFYLTKLKHRF